MESYQDIKQGERGAWVSIIAYICLTALKVSVGFAAGSDALIADGYNNATDIIASTAVLIGLMISRKPPDHDHRYGHFRAQTVAALLASFIMITVGLSVLVDAFQSLLHPKTHTPDMIAAYTALFSAAVMFGVYQYNMRLAKRINNLALTAAAQDNRSDAFVSIGAFVGIAGAQWGLPWLDTLAAFVVGLLICKTAWEIFKEATHSLTDGFDEEQLDEYRQAILAIPGVQQLNDIRARRHGNKVLLDVVIAVHPHLTVVDSHDITEEIEEHLLQNEEIYHVHIHIEPAT